MNDDYSLLVAMGHSPAKAAEIILDAKRGDEHALKWIRLARLAPQPEPGE